MAEAYFLPEAELRGLLLSIGADHAAVNAFVEADCSRTESTRLYLPLEQASDEQLAAGLRSPRPHYPFKSVLMPARELVARYGEGDSPSPLEALAGESLLLVGMRGSDCRALGYLDRVMLADPVPDPFYERRRAGLTVVSVDCVEPCESCFCNLLGEKAYAEENFDVNLSPVEGGYVAVAGSEKGEGILSGNQDRLEPAGEEPLRQRDRARERAAEQLQRQNADYAPTTAEELAALMPDTLEEAFWFGELAACVQCGGCTAVCPTCYCFLLHDLEAETHRFQRVRLWDSCQFTGYSEMAGPPGTTPPDPRRTHMDKFQRRFAHKFWHDVKVNAMLGCVGCGRCRESCPGAIDLRRVITAVQSARVQNA